MRNKNKLKVLCALCVFFFAGGVQKAKGAKNNNYPIPAEQMYMRDPFVTVDRQNHCYYIITSRWDNGRGGLFAYKSEDLQNWREEGFVYKAAPDYLGTNDFWAPDTYEYNGNYYVFLTVSNAEKGILRGTTILKSTTGTVMGPYEPVLPAHRLNMTPESMQCLDASLFVDDNGTPWMVFAVEWCGPNVQDKVGEVWAQQLNRELTGTVGEPYKLFKASDAEWPLHLDGGGMITDAPFIWKDDKSGNLIMLWSSFSPEYSIGQAVSENGNVLGPWKHEAETVFSANGGHQMVFRDLQGNLKMSFHSPNSPANGKRETLTIRDIQIKDGKIVPLDNCRQHLTGSYTNPLKTTDGKLLRVADPYVYSHNGMYYLTGTTGGDGFDYYTSTDMVTWEYKGALYRKSDKHDAQATAFWAPEVKRYNGRYYLTYSCTMPGREHRMLSSMAVSNNPAGPFEDIRVPWYDFGYPAIDSHLFVDDDGTPYLYYSKNYSIDGKVAVGEIYGVRMKRDLSGPVGEPVLISSASQEWEKVRWDVNRCNEGPAVVKHNGKYYMTYSANDTGFEYYGVGVAYADHPLGPWKKSKHNPLMTTDRKKGVSSPGHNSLVVAPDGQLYIVYHRHADPDCQKPNWDRVVCIDRLYFNRIGQLKTDGPSVKQQEIDW